MDEPLAVTHGNAECVKSGSPAIIRVCLDVLIVHKGHVFQQKDVWFMVYDGSLPDAMLSESLLNSIACTDSPGTTLLDTRARECDLPILLQQMDDYQQLSEHRIRTSRLEFAEELRKRQAELATASPTINTASAATPSTADETPAPASSSASASAAAEAEHERIKALLADMARQRSTLMARLGKPISDEAFATCMSVLDRYPDNFRPPGHDPCKLGLFRIILKDKTKFHIALPRRVNPIVLAEMRRQVEELVAQGAIERCRTRPSSIYAIVMAKRPNSPGKMRLCVDLVEGNSNTVPEPYAIPEVQQALDRLSGKAIYSTFDFSSWFHQFEIAEEDRDKVAFVVPGDNLTPPQIYRYKRVAFGLMNATYFCQRQLQEALETWPGCQGIFPFVDDIVIGSDTLEEHLIQLEAFMEFCKHFNIRLKKDKTELCTTAVKHVGFILTKEGQFLDPARVDSLLSIGAPKNIDGLKSLLGSFGFVRAWLADCAQLAAPLTDLMSATAKRLKFEWGPAQDAALAALKAACQLAPAKVAPDYDLPFHVFVDASDVGVAAVLVQFHPDEHCSTAPFAIYHASRRWAPREAKWEISIREMYAIRYGLFKFREYLQGVPDVTVHSDHLNLVNGLWKHSSPKIQRWRMFLESMRPFKLQHISGTDPLQVPADALSRLHMSNLDYRPTEEELDPATMRMMARGEGEDDAAMFAEPYTSSVFTQTSDLAALADIQLHNAICRVTHPISLEERRLQQLYGNGFNIAARCVNHPPTPTATPWYLSGLSPLQPVAATGRPGIGFGADFASHKFHKISPVESVTKILENSTTSGSATFTHSDFISSCCYVCDWSEEEENRNHSLQSRTFSTSLLQCNAIQQSKASSASSLQCNAILHATSQTAPQDYLDLARERAGGFPLLELLERAHDDTHPSFLCTWRRVIKALGPRPGETQAAIKEEVKRYCNACMVCQKIKPAREKLFMRTGSIRSRPFASYAFDIVTLSEPDADGCRYILVCVDSFSRAVELFALKQANAQEVFQALNDVLCRWGTPHELRCDNAKAFTSSMVKA